MSKRKLSAVIDLLAVPVAAGIVGWIVVGAWIAPHAPAALAGGPLELAGALLAFWLALRYL